MPAPGKPLRSIHNLRIIRPGETWELCVGPGRMRAYGVVEWVRLDHDFPGQGSIQLTNKEYVSIGQGSWLTGERRDPTERRVADDAIEVEQKYRRELWSNHGHQGLYGDDGELQCVECGVDYKRDPLERVEEAAYRWRIVRLARAQQASAAPSQKEREIARQVAKAHYKTHPTPDAKWYQEEVLIVSLADVIAEALAAVRRSTP